MRTSIPPTGGKQCAATRRDGRRCRARASLEGSDLCFAHDASTAAKRDAARSAGGRNRANHVRAAAALPSDLRGVLGVLLESLPATRDGSLPPATAGAVASLAGAIVKVWTLAESDQRIAALEARLGVGRERTP